MHFEELGLNRGFDRRQQTNVIHSAKRLQPLSGFGNESIRPTRFGGREQFLKKLAGNGRHIARDNKIPLSGGIAQCSMQPAQRSATRHLIGKHPQAEVSILFHGPDQGDASSRVGNFTSDRLNQGGSFPRQQRFVLAHPGALATGQHKTSPAAPGTARHEMMVAIGASMLTNKRVYICFISVFAMLLAASPLRLAAAGNIPVGEDSAQNQSIQSARKTSSKPSQKALVVRADRRTGKLVRSVVPVNGAPAIHEEASIDISRMVEQAARENDVDPLLVHSIIQVESNYNPYAVSPKGAQGLMQLMPPTARDLGVSNSFDPRQNIEAGVRYLKSLQDLYKDDRLALAAYNAGPGAVQKYKWIPPYPETQDYVNRVGEQYGAAKKAAAQHLAEPAAPPVGVTEEKRPKLEPFVDAEGRLHLRTSQQ